MVLCFLFIISVWESEEWLKEHVKPLAQSGGLFIFFHLIYDLNLNLFHCHSGVQGRLAQIEEGEGGGAEENEGGDGAMEE